MFEEPWTVAAIYSAIVTICMAFTAFLCLCGCRAKERKDELVGIEGHVYMTDPDMVQTQEKNGSVGGGDPVKRSLPDLPVPSNDGPWEPGGDSASELYATVGLQKNSKDSSPPVAKEHPYENLNAAEHPYAQVTADVLPSPAAPREIAAASAIAGQVHASDDLPYMTPPTHFSGDSQDSAKGYTSISVREPLAAIRAETSEIRPERSGSNDQHYMTVSDDSDDMYAAIDEPSGSETYAQIQPTIESDIKPSETYSAVKPAPPSVDSLRSAPIDNQIHSRQESSSSATSTINSPKPEKREANSPLPAPPAATSSGEDRALDDMYAKVNKKRRRDLEETLERGASTESGSSESVSYRIQSNNISTTDSSCPGQSATSISDPTPGTSTLSTHSCHSHSTTESRADHQSDSSMSSDESRASYEKLQEDPRYETLNKETLGKRDPEYETLEGNISDPCYATLRQKPDPGYETLNNGVQEPKYETLGRGPPSDLDPNYERIVQNHDYASLPFNRGEESPYAVVPSDIYAAVVKQKRKDPPYASIGGDVEQGEPPYSSLKGEEFSSEPEYESVQYVGGHVDPPYQMLADFESGNEHK